MAAAGAFTGAVLDASIHTDDSVVKYPPSPLKLNHNHVALGNAANGAANGAASGIHAAKPGAVARDGTSAGYYALNVLLNTVLFMMIFMTATAWAGAAQETIKGMRHGRGMLVFAGVATAVTFAVAVGFGLLSDAVPKIYVDYASLLDRARSFKQSVS